MNQRMTGGFSSTRSIIFQRVACDEHEDTGGYFIDSSCACTTIACGAIVGFVGQRQKTRSTTLCVRDPYAWLQRLKAVIQDVARCLRLYRWRVW